MNKNLSYTRACLGVILNLTDPLCLFLTRFRCPASENSDSERQSNPATAVWKLRWHLSRQDEKLRNEGAGGEVLSKGPVTVVERKVMEMKAIIQGAALKRNPNDLDCQSVPKDVVAKLAGKPAEKKGEGVTN